MLSKLLSIKNKINLAPSQTNVGLSKELSERGIALATIILYLYLKEMPQKYQKLTNIYSSRKYSLITSY